MTQAGLIEQNKCDIITSKFHILHETTQRVFLLLRTKKRQKERQLNDQICTYEISPFLTLNC